MRGRSAIWHTLWSETYSNPRYAELVPRLEHVFFAPIRQRPGIFGRADGAVARRSRFVERRTLEWYRGAGLDLLLTPNVEQPPLFAGPAVVDLDDPSCDPNEQAALRFETLRHVIVPTEEIAAYARASNLTVDITVLPQGVDLERAARARHAERRSEIVARAGLPSQSVIVGYHAPVLCLSDDQGFAGERFHTFYIDVLLSAVRRLWSEGRSFATVLVGTPSSTIREFANTERRLVLADYVERNRLFDWVGAFDVGAYPRMVDFGGRQSVKLLEYMANRAAIVAMRTRETRFLQETGTGYTARDPEQFLALLRRLIAHREERYSMIDRARTLVNEHDWTALAARYDRVLADVAAKR